IAIPLLAGLGIVGAPVWWWPTMSAAHGKARPMSRAGEYRSEWWQALERCGTAEMAADGRDLDVLRILDASIEFARQISGDGAVSLAGQQQRLRLDPRQRRLHVVAERHRGVMIIRYLA